MIDERFKAIETTFALLLDRLHRSSAVDIAEIVQLLARLHEDARMTNEHHAYMDQILHLHMAARAVQRRVARPDREETGGIP